MAINLYEVLNIHPTSNKKDIKKAYRKLVKKFHPDHGGDAQIFELIAHAYNVLSNDDSRQTYDKNYKVSTQAETDFFSLKKSAEDYYENEAFAKTKEEAQLEFELSNAELDQQHGFVRDDDLLNEIDADDFNQRINDLKHAREQEEIEYEPDNLFEGQKLSGEEFNSKFNAAWKKAHGTQPMSMTVYNNTPMAHNDGFSSFQGLNESSLYNDDTSNFEADQGYAPIDFGFTGRPLTKADVSNLTGECETELPADTKEYKDLLEKRMEERRQETLHLDDMEMGDFDNDDTLGGYGISHQIGFEGDQLDWEGVSEKLNKSYVKLLKLRETEKEEELDVDLDLLRQLRQKRKEKNNHQ